MEIISSAYDLLKDIVGLAKKAKNQVMIEKLIELQSMLIDLKDENQNLKEKIKELQEQIETLNKCPELEKDLTYYQNGFVTINKDKPLIPYCSHCWKTRHQLIPLSQQTSGGWWKYSCGTCKVDVVVMREDGQPLNSKEENK